MSQSEDSLASLISNANSDHEKAMMYQEFGWDLSSSNNDQSIVYYLKAVELESLLTDHEKVSLYNDLARAYAQSRQFDLAENNFSRASKLADSIGDYASYIRANSRHVNSVLFEKMNFRKALNIALATIDKIEPLKVDTLDYRANRLLLDVYFMLPDVEREFAKLAAKNLFLAESIGNKIDIDNSLFNLALGYSRNTESEKAILTYKKFISRQTDPPNYWALGAANNNMAAQFNRLDKVDSAVYFYNLGLDAATAGGRRVSIAASHLYLGKIMVEQSQFDKGIEHCELALKIFREDSIMRRRDVCALCLFEAYKGKGLESKALAYLELSIQLEDQYMDDQSKHDLEVMRKDHEFMLEHVADSLAFEKEKQMKDVIILNEQLELEKVDKEKSTLVTIVSLSTILGILAIALGIIAFRRYRVAQKQNVVILKQQKKTEEQKRVIDEAYAQLEEKNGEIIDSINYAQRIQSALLPEDEVIAQKFPSSFVFYKPKDIVAGDFYWTNDSGKSNMIAAADCTGHGVPGAMVSVICYNALNRVTREFGLTDPAEILDKTRDIVIKELNNASSDVKDGMDISLLAFADDHVDFAGAHNPLWIVRKNALIQEGDPVSIKGDEWSLLEIKGDKQPIGKFHQAKPFTTHRIDLLKEDTVYAFTDGYADQFGGEKGKKFKSINFKRLLIKMQDQDLATQKISLESFINEWMGSYDQLDDMCVIAIKK